MLNSCGPTMKFYTQPFHGYLPTLQKDPKHHQQTNKQTTPKRVTKKHINPARFQRNLPLFVNPRYAECMEYLPYIWHKFIVNVRKYFSSMEHVGMFQQDLFSQ